MKPQMSASAFIKWCKSCQRTHRGRIWMHNAVEDVRQKRVSQSAVLIFCDAIQDILTQPGATPIDDTSVSSAEVYYNTVIDGRDSELLCKGEGSPIGSRCSRIMNVRDFMAYNVRSDFKRMCGIYNNDFEHPQASFNRICNAVRAGKRGWSDGDIRGARPIAWVTMTGAISTLRNNCHGGLPERVRDMLGLNHYKEDEVLIEIRYPATISALHLTPPTFLDAGPNLVFRSDRDADGWGTTVNLHETGKDGLPEAVHSPIPIRDDFDFEIIGQLDGVNHNISWEVLAHSCPDCQAFAACDSTPNVCPLLALS